MALDVIGAGLGRTGTHSLRIALERLLGARCYHMLDLLQHPQHVRVWQQALEGHLVDWDRLFSGYRASVDWASGAFFSELAAAYPDAIVLLSVRDVDEWWESIRNTAFEALRSEPDPSDDPLENAIAAARRFTIRMLEERFTPEWADESAAKEAFARHNAAVRVAIPGDRLVEWRPGDGWEPICAALGVSIPEEPFPHVSTRADFRAFLGLDPVR